MDSRGTKTEPVVFLTDEAETDSFLLLHSSVEQKQVGTLGTPIVLTIRHSSRTRHCKRIRDHAGAYRDETSSGTT
jgi:hypothetical protein